MKKNNFYLVLIIIIGLLLRVFLLINEGVYDTDAAYYAMLGHNFFESGEYSYGENYNMGILWPPGAPLIIGITELLIPDLEMAGRIIVLLFGILTIPTLYLIGLEFNNEKAGLYSALIYSIYPFISRTSVVPITEAFFFLFMYLVVLVYAKMIIKGLKIKYGILFGVFTGLAFLIKPEGLFFMILPFIALLSNKNIITQIKLFFGKNFATILIILICFSIIIMPYTLFLTKELDMFTITGKHSINKEVSKWGMNLNYTKIFYTINDDSTQLKIFSNENKESLTEYIINDHKTFFKLYSIKAIALIKYFFITISPILLSIFVALLIKKKEKNILKFFFGLISLAAVYFFLYPIYTIEGLRYTYIQVCLLIPISGFGFAYFPKFINKICNHIKLNEKKKKQLVMGAQVLIILILVIASLGYATHKYTSKKTIIESCIFGAEFLKDKYSKQELSEINVMSRKPLISFYAESKLTLFPLTNDIDSILKYANLHNVDYIVVDRFLNSDPTYLDLQKLDSIKPNIKLEYFNDNQGDKIWLFRLIKNE